MTNRRNILFLAPRVPYPPDKGDRIRTFHHLRHLALKHRVCLACFDDQEPAPNAITALQRLCQEVFALPLRRSALAARAAAAWVRGQSIALGAYRDELMMRRLADWTRLTQFDVAVAFSACMAPYALGVPARRRVLDLCDADSRKWALYARGSAWPLSRWMAAEAARLREAESECPARFDAVTVITDRERALVDPEGRADNLLVVPNGVNGTTPAPPPASRRGRTICFVGAMDYRPNIEGIVWFARRVWPLVLKALPNARLCIIGHRPARRVRRLARLRGIDVAGAVQDPRRQLGEARVAIAPLWIACGLQNKVLEAMAMRRPVVATSAVAACVDARPGREFLVADRPTAFARCVVNLCTDDALCDAVADAGRARVAKRYEWSSAVSLYEHVVFGRPVQPDAGRINAGAFPFSDRHVIGLDGMSPIADRRAGAVAARMNDDDAAAPSGEFAVMPRTRRLLALL